MTAKTDLIKSLQNSGIDLAESTLKRKSLAELETMWSALKDRDDAANDAANAGKVADVTDAETDCGGCENGECDECGMYECCNQDAGTDTDIDVPMPVGNFQAQFSVDAAFEIAALGLGAKDLGAYIIPFMGHDGQSVRVKDRDSVSTMVETMKELQKVATAVLYHRDPAASKAALRAVREHLVRLEDAI